MKAIFLDRDGTLIIDKNFLNDPNQIEYFDGVVSALKELRDAGFKFFIVTNQSGIASGKVELHNLKEIHRRMTAHLSSQGVDVLDYYVAQAPSGSDEFMRKPNPGMIITAANEYNIDLSESWMIGDKDMDIEAGKRAGCRTVFYWGGHKTAPATTAADVVSRSWVEIATAILQSTKAAQ